MINVRTLLRVSLIACFMAGCVESFDTTRRPHREATPGEGIYEVLCNRLAIRENPHDVSGRATRALCQGTGTPGAGTSLRLKTLHNNRARLVQALDATLGIDSTGTGAVQVDADLAPQVRTLLDQMLPLYDSGLMAKHNAALTPWLQQLRSASVADTLAAQSSRQWYSQSVVQDANQNFVVPTAALPIVMSFDALVDLGVAFDKVFGEGTADAGVFADWLAQAQKSLASYTPQQASGFLRDYLLREDGNLDGDPRPLYSVLRDQDGDAEVLSTREDLAPTTLQTAPFGDANSAWSGLYSRDAYGRLESEGELLYAYQDLNKTPLAAVLRQVQRWMQAIEALPNGAAPGGQQALAASNTGNGAGNATLLDGAAWLEAVLQSDTAATVDTNKLAGQNSDSPVLDAAAAAGWMSTQETMQTVLPLARLLWNEDEPDVARLIQLFAGMSRRMDDNDLAGVQLRPGNTFVDDMIDVAQKMATHPGLLTRVMDALKDPETAKLGPLFAKYMTTTDAIDYDQSDFRSSKTIGHFTTQVDRTRGDVYGNESVFQRLMYLVHDASGLAIVNNAEVFPYAPGELFKIDDAALFYLRSIIGKARMTICSREEQKAFFDLGNTRYLGGREGGLVFPPADTYGYTYYIEYAMGLSGLTPQASTPDEKAYCANVINPDDIDDEHVAYTYSVTPKAAARMLFMDPDKLYEWSEQQAEHIATGAYGVPYPPSKMYDEPIIDGHGFRTLHGQTLFAWEKDGFQQAITPLLMAFAKPDPGASEGNEPLFLELMNVLHKHWSSTRSNRTQSTDASRANYAAQTGLEQFEPLLAYALAAPDRPDGSILDLAGNLLRFIDDDGSDEADDAYLTPVSALGDGMGTMLGVRQGAALPQRDPFVDAQTLLGRPNPVLRKSDGVTPIAHPAPAHVLNRLAHHVAVQTENFDRQRPGMGAVFGALLDTFSKLTPDGTRLENRETHALVSGLLDYMMQHLPEMGQDLRGDTNNLLGSPLLAASLDLMTTFNRANPEAGSLVQALVTHLVSDEQRPALLNTATRTLYTASDTRVDLRPLAQAAAKALDYPDGALPMTLKLASSVHDVDTAAVMPRLMANLGRPLPHPANQNAMGETPIDVFVDVYQQINRTSPTETDALSARDHAAIIDSLANFVEDGKQGFVRLLEIIAHRHGS